jgi:ATP-binding protein involved in chromosome partitioning
MSRLPPQANAALSTSGAHRGYPGRVSDASPRAATDSAATTPRKIAQKGPRELSIQWADGTESIYAVRALRLACICASCVDEWTGENRLDAASVPEDVQPTKIESVGRYAIQIEWSDGHSSGIYPFRRLRALASE